VRTDLDPLWAVGLAPRHGPDGALARRVRDYVRAAVMSYPVTPLVTLEVKVAGLSRTVMLKLEGHSPWGSMKGRTALALVLSVRTQLPDGGATIVESTSGNLGVALAAICRELGLGFVAVVDSRLPPAMRERLVRLGGRLVEVDAPPTNPAQVLLRIQRVRELVSAAPDMVWTNQYENEANRRVHARWTARELARQVGPAVEAVFAPVSTGGSFAGVAQYFRQAQPGTRVVAVDVAGSIVFGGVPGPRLLTGIGAARRSTFIPAQPPPEHVMVSDLDGIACCRTLLADTGLRLGGSSGATLAGCLRYLGERPELRAVACLCPDLGDSYQQTIYDDRWLARHSDVVPDVGRRIDIRGESVQFVLSGERVGVARQGVFR
jgi:cysteine synthase A